MGANEKRSLSVSAMSIFLVIFYQLVFNTNHTGATTSLSAQFNFNNNSSSSTYHYNGSVDECLIMDGIDSGLIFMESVHTTRILGDGITKSIPVGNFLDAKQAVVTCGRGKPYTSCLPPPHPPPPPGKKPQPCGATYGRTCPTS